jgi:signal transduction histidine kinase
LGLPDHSRERLTGAWLQARAVVVSALAAVSVTLAVVWGWPEGLAVAAFAAASAVDSVIRYRSRRWGPPIVSMFFDATAICFGMGIANVPDSALGIPYAYLVLAAMLFLPLRWALAVAGYGAVWYTALVRDWAPAGSPLSEYQVIGVGIVTDVFFAVAFVTVIAMLVKIINRERQRIDHHAGLRDAIATASSVLLRGSEADPLTAALAPLLGATSATAVFVERNVEDPALGLCSSLVAEVLAPGMDPDPEDLWVLSPWSKMSGADALAAGRSHSLVVSELTGTERELYEGTGVRSELDIPIFVDGEWWGLVGFSDAYAERPWAATDESLLFTAAQMIGAYLERQQVRDELDATIAGLDQQVRYQHALAECSAALLRSSDDRAVDLALEALLSVTDADYAYIDVNYEDAELGLCTRVLHEADTPGSPPVAARAEWWGGPYAELPTAHAALSAGRPVRIVTSQLEGREREIYEDDGIVAELCIPIQVAGRWRGSIAFADYADERAWSALEVRVLRTAAEMIGAHWERVEAKQRLERLVNDQEVRLRYEQAISLCSRALLSGEGESAIDDALRHLLEATNSHDVFVDVNVEDPELGLVAEVTHEVIRPGYETIVDAEIWTDPTTGEERHSRIAYSRLPRIRAALQAGKPAIVLPRTLEGEAFEVYGDDGCKSELNIPIMMNGAWVGAVGFADYIEERTWETDEIALLQTAAEMVAAFWQRERATARLESLVRSKDDFVAAISHELRTPLTTVVGLAAELRDRPGDFAPGEAELFVSHIAEHADEVADLVEDLLVAARRDIATLVVATVPVDLGATVDAVVSRSGAAEGLTIEVTGGDAKVLADPMRLRQILRNLLINARRYGRGRARVRVEVLAEKAVVVVADDGPGVPEHLVETIFEPYGIAHQTTTQPQSVGLGLSVSRHLARLMRGDLTYARRDGWTEFALMLPVATDAARLTDARPRPS